MGSHWMGAPSRLAGDGGDSITKKQTWAVSCPRRLLQLFSACLVFPCFLLLHLPGLLLPLAPPAPFPALLCPASITVPHHFSSHPTRRQPCLAGLSLNFSPFETSKLTT